MYVVNIVNQELFSVLGFGDDILENCYYRNKPLDGKINVDTGYI